MKTRLIITAIIELTTSGAPILIAAALGGALAVTSVCVASPNEPVDGSAATNTPSKFRSSEDGWLDISSFVDQSYGFIPIAFPITEPALGYGVAGGLTFIDKPDGEAQAGFGRPDITAVGGMVTDNESWGVMAGDARHWRDDRLQTLVGLGYASINLDFYGIGEDRALVDRPLTYNLETVAGGVRAKYRLADSRWWAGLGYTFATTQVEFDAPLTQPGRPSFQPTSQMGGLLPTLSYDSRDTLFTPTRGTVAEATAGLFSQVVGGDDEFQRVNLIMMHYVPLHPKLTLGLRADGNLSFGDVPFYMRPFVYFRGVPAMRYQGEHVAQAEVELRWQFWRRFSLVGFAGGGTAWTDLERFEKTRRVGAGGAGFRYELARNYGLHMGLDVAIGPDDPILYVQFGSAWLRP